MKFVTVISDIIDDYIDNNHANTMSTVITNDR